MTIKPPSSIRYFSRPQNEVLAQVRRSDGVYYARYTLTKLQDKLKDNMYRYIKSCEINEQENRQDYRYIFPKYIYYKCYSIHRSGFNIINRGNTQLNDYIGIGDGRLIEIDQDTGQYRL